MLDGLELFVADLDVFGDVTLVVQDSDDVLCSLNNDIGGGAVGDCVVRSGKNSTVSEWRSPRVPVMWQV